MKLLTMYIRKDSAKIITRSLGSIARIFGFSGLRNAVFSIAGDRFMNCYNAKRRYFKNRYATPIASDLEDQSVSQTVQNRVYKMGNLGG